MYAYINQRIFSTFLISIWTCSWTAIEGFYFKADFSRDVSIECSRKLILWGIRCAHKNAARVPPKMTDATFEARLCDSRMSAAPRPLGPDEDSSLGGKNNRTIVGLMYSATITCLRRIVAVRRCRRCLCAKFCLAIQWRVISRPLVRPRGVSKSLSCICRFRSRK